MKLNKTILFLLAFYCFTWIQAQVGCGEITITEIEEIHWDVDEIANGAISIKVHDEDMSVGTITFEYSGNNGVNRSEFELLPKEEDPLTGIRTYEIEALAAGTYTVLVRKYCILQWGNPEDVASEVSEQVTVRAVPSLVAQAEEERPALASCIFEGIAKISITKGTGPYTLEITDGPANNPMIGNTYTFNSEEFYLYGLQNGTYNGVITDNNGFQANYSFSITTYPLNFYSYINFTYQTDSPVLIKPYLNHADGPYNVFFIDGSSLHGQNPSSYTTEPDSLLKYFNLRWCFDDDESTTYPIEYRELKPGDSKKHYCFTLPEGMNFKDITDNSKMLNIIQVGYNQEVLDAPDCYTNNNRKMLTNALNLKQYEPIADVGSEVFQFDVYSMVGANGCTAALRFPVSPSSDIELIILPIEYTVNFKEADGTLTPIRTGSYHEGDQTLRIPDVAIGNYVIRYKDALENEWTQELEVDESHTSQPITNISFGAHPQLRSFAFKDYQEENADDYNDLGAYISPQYTFEGGALHNNMIYIYEEVPNGFYLPAGTRENVNVNVNNQFFPTRDNGGYYQFVPGKYRVSFHPPDTCVIPYVHEFIIDKPEIENFAYEITTDCNNLNVELASGIRFLHPDRSRGVNGNKYYWNGLYYCIAIERTDIDGLTQKEFFDTSKKQYSSVKNTAIPLNNILQMNGKEVVDCKLSVYFYIGQGTLTDIGDFSGLASTRRFYYAREIDMDFDGLKSGEYAIFKIDPTRTNGYICNGQAHVSAMATGGNGSYTYSLYETTSFDQLPGPGDTPVDTQTGGTNEVVTFTITNGQAGQRYWVKADDDSGCFESKYNGVVTYSLDTSMDISKTEDLCDGDELNLEIYYLPGATYTWYYGGTVQNGEVVGGIIRQNGVGLNTYTVTSNAQDSHLGTYHVKVVEEATCGITGNIYSVDITFVPQVMVWDPQNNSSDWDDENNWYPKNQGLPFDCTDVYIPGNVSSFPSLTEGGANICRDIYFMPGAQLGQPQLLEYRYAYAQIDYGTGVLGSTQNKAMTKDELIAIGRDHITSANRTAFGAATSGVELKRDRWNMLSAPLGYITTGDFAFGGFPFSYIKKFDPAGNEETYISGKWADYSNEGSLIFQGGQGFGHLYFDYDQMPYYSMDHISQWDQVKAQNGLRAPTPQSASGSTTNFGLAQTNGILQFPYFADDNLSSAHRNHIFTRNGTEPGNITDGVSSFHFYYQSPLEDVKFLQLTGEATESYRAEKAYRFIPEQHTFQRNNLDFTYAMGTFTAGDIVLIGNPYMSALDFEAFAAANPRIKDTGYQIFNGRDGYHEVVDQNGSGIQMVPPMQSILVEIASTGALNAVFVAKDMAKTAPDAMLRSSTGMVAPNSLVITASNPDGEVKAHIRQSDEANDGFCRFDMSKIIAAPATGTRPEIYTLAATDDAKKRALVVNTIRSNDLIIPIGIVTTYSGDINLEFSGMDTYYADILFIDTEAEPAEMNITGKNNFSYSFPYISRLNEDGSAIAREDRFMLRIIPKDTSQPDNRTITDDIVAYIQHNDLIIISSQDNIIEDIYGYDMQGRILFSRHDVRKTFFKEQSLPEDKGVYLIKIHTRHGIKEVKIVR